MLKNNKSHKLIIATILAVFVVFVIGFAAKDKINSNLVSSSPQYVVSHAITAYNQHDANAFSVFVDTNAVSSSIYNSWKTYKTTSFNKAFAGVPANSQITFSKYINQLVEGQLTIDSQTTKGNVGIGVIINKINNYSITNVKTTGDTQAFDLVAKTDNGDIVIPMTMIKSGDNWKINSVNVTNLFNAYDNELKKEYIEFFKSMQKYNYADGIKKISKYGNINVGPFITSTYGEAVKQLDLADKELNEMISVCNDTIKIFNNAPETSMNDVAKVYTFYALAALKYNVDAATVKLYLLEHVNPAYKASNPSKDIIASDLYIDQYMEAKEKIAKLGHLAGHTEKLGDIINLAS